jgi:transketolase
MPSSSKPFYTILNLACSGGLMDELSLKAKSIRKNILVMLNKAGSGHTGGSLGMADVFTVLYFKVLQNIHTEQQDRDRFILSNGHINPVWYATLAEANFLSQQELLSLRQVNSRLQGHPANKELPLVEISTGSLGQGFPAAVGLALGYKIDKKQSKIYVGLGDGELQEGSMWEAFMAAAHYKLDNLIAFIDRNWVQQSGKTEDMMALEPLKKKLEAFNWNVIEADGHNLKDIQSAFEKAQKTKGKPSVIIFKTEMGKGVSFINGSYEWHGVAPSDEQMQQGLKDLEAK